MTYGWILSGRPLRPHLSQARGASRSQRQPKTAASNNNFNMREY
jgi:hypothetical protein